MSNTFDRIIERLSSNDPTLTVLNLRKCKLTIDNMKKLAFVLRTNTTLKNINLGFKFLNIDEITEIAFIEIINAISINTTLKSLNLRCDPMCFSDLTFNILKSIEILLCTNKSLVSLNLSGHENIFNEYCCNNEIVRGIASNTTLKSLDITGCYINAHGGSMLRDALYDNPCSAIINLKGLRCNRIRDSVIDDINTIIKNNKSIAEIINKNTPPLSEGYGDCGEFDVLPNEILCQIAMLAWPSFQALQLAHTCRRWRDCIFSDWVLTDRHYSRYFVRSRDRIWIDGKESYLDITDNISMHILFHDIIYE